MGTIIKSKNKDGSISFKLQIRMKNQSISKTFFTEEDAKLYEFYKERLISNMENFEVDLCDTITLVSVIEIKKKTIDDSNMKEKNDYDNCIARILDFFGETFLAKALTYEKLIEYCKHLLSTHVYRGAKSENGKRLMSTSTMRKNIAHLSASFSNAQKMGIALDNVPMKVISTYINPMIKNKNDL